MDSLFIVSIPSALFATLAAWLVYVVAQIVHRLYFSPIAKFPGPTLAAASHWYVDLAFSIMQMKITN